MCVLFIDHLCTMKTKVAMFVLAFLLFIALFTTVSEDPVHSYGPIVCSRNQLLALRNTVVLRELRPIVPTRAKERETGKLCWS